MASVTFCYGYVSPPLAPLFPSFPYRQHTMTAPISRKRLLDAIEVCSKMAPEACLALLEALRDTPVAPSNETKAEATAARERAKREAYAPVGHANDRVSRARLQWQAIEHSWAFTDASKAERAAVWAEYEAARAGAALALSEYRRWLAANNA